MLRSGGVQQFAAGATALSGRGLSSNDGHLLGARREPPIHARRWAFAEFTDVWQMQVDFEQKVAQAFDVLIDQVVVGAREILT